MFDFGGLSGFNSENSLYMILFTNVMTIIMSLVLVFTYDKTTPPAGRSNHFIQSLLLMSVVTATIMQSIGDSLALSFGIFGALAIIRFRSNISDLRDIAFIFATMAIGIACGVHSFQNALIGTLTFCLIIFLLKISPFDSKHNIKGSLRVETDNGPENLGKIEYIISNHAAHIILSRYRTILSPENNLTHEYEYSFVVNNVKSGDAMIQEIGKINGIKVTKLLYEDKIFSNNNI
ncbi:MAG: DUF4956 domain-containing protein [Saprospiraceae bacterium]|jgi:uncharacterized membrane protein YhiD involved in acid resistance